jgi:ornithine--oxo-acid transaminase
MIPISASVEPLPPAARRSFNDLAALERALSSKQVAAFIVEPIQGKGINLPTDEFLPGARALPQIRLLFIADEIQTGIGRTGKFLG